MLQRFYEAFLTILTKGLPFRASWAKIGVAGVQVEAGERRYPGQFWDGKQYNLDAVHDTVYEMAKEGVRHGKTFEGLLKRSFG